MLVNIKEKICTNDPLDQPHSPADRDITAIGLILDKFRQMN